MVQRFREFTALAEEPAPIPSTHRAAHTACNCSVGASKAICWHLPAPHAAAIHRNTQACKHLHVKWANILKACINCHGVEEYELKWHDLG